MSPSSGSRALAKYWKFFDIGLQNTFVYRWNFLLRSVFGIVPLVGTVFLWQAVFATSGKEIAGYDFSSMIFYFMLVVFLDQPHHADRGRMADRRRNPRRQDQRLSHQAAQLPRLPRGALSRATGCSTSASFSCRSSSLALIFRESPALARAWRSPGWPSASRR